MPAASFAKMGFYPGTPGYPTGSPAANPETQDRANINYLLNPYGNLDETRTRAAEASVGGGVPGSGFGANQATRLLDSERIARMQLGHQLLEPYLQRDFQTQQQANEAQARLNEIAAQGANALQQLQLSEAGQTQRLTQQEAAALQRQVLSGQQAMAQLNVQESGQNSRLRTSIGGNILQTLLTRPATRTTTSPGEIGSYGSGIPPGVYPVDVNGTPIYPSRPATATRTSTTSGVPNISTGTIDNILRRYGLF